jgi:hypothetical protein
LVHSGILIPLADKNRGSSVGLIQTFATKIRIKPEFTLRRVWWPSAV